jgi:hypothetical protein
MKLILGLVLALTLTACNQTDTTKQQLRDTNLNTTNVSNESNIGKGQEYGQEKKKEKKIVKFYKEKYSQFGVVTTYKAIKDWYNPNIECLYIEVDMPDDTTYEKLMNVYSQMLTDRQYLENEEGLDTYLMNGNIFYNEPGKIRVVQIGLDLSGINNYVPR